MVKEEKSYKREILSLVGLLQQKWSGLVGHLWLECPQTPEDALPYQAKQRV